MELEETLWAKGGEKEKFQKSPGLREDWQDSLGKRLPVRSEYTRGTSAKKRILSSTSS